MTADFYTNSTGRTVTADDAAYAVIWRMAQRVLGDDDTNGPPPAVMPPLPASSEKHVGV